jgi:hypothetical protein
MNGGHMKNEITVMEVLIKEVLDSICGDPPEAVISKDTIASTVFYSYSDFSIRKVRKAVEILISRGHKILPHNGGYSIWSEDPKPVREYLNKEYHKLTESRKKLDAMYHTFKETFGDAEAAKVEQMSGQPALIDIKDTLHNV